MRRKEFSMPQPASSREAARPLERPLGCDKGEQQKTALAIVGVLRKVVTNLAAVHEDIHQSLRKIEELDMKVSELASKVDTLINVAMDLKAAAHNAGQSQVPQDDPQLKEIADRIDRAVDELRGLSGQVPGAGAISTPGDTGGNPDQGGVGGPGQGSVQDPNAPLV